MGSTATIPMLSLDGGLTHYLTQNRKFPMLRPEEESAYAKRWREQGDREAAYRLVTSHLRLVDKRSPCDIGATACRSRTSFLKETSA
jgi:RNA polymerase sigma-32 factor